MARNSRLGRLKQCYLNLLNAGCGLLYYGQNYLIYPSAFPPGSRTGSLSPPNRWYRSQIRPDVDLPTKYGLVYEDLILRTEDGITLRSYLLMQRKEISHPHALQVDWTEDQSNEDVRLFGLAFLLVTLTSRRGIVCGHTTHRHHVPW